VGESGALGSLEDEARQCEECDFEVCDTSGGFTWDAEQCCCALDGTCASPVIIDTAGNGFDLTDAVGGVRFDLNSDGIPELLSWTAPGVDDAFLVLDRNGNGLIENGEELFGNYTPQPPHPEKNGFLALAEHDKPSNGGNSDGRISSSDAVFGSLRLWQDTNHDGVSDSAELHTLASKDVLALDLNYKRSRRTDRHGNQFRYRAKVRDSRGANVGRWAWDVFLLRG
jgi:hypothetical protein